jgi:hypothetical protein
MMVPYREAFAALLQRIITDRHDHLSIWWDFFWA